DRDVDRLLVEGGGETIWSFFDAGAVDRLVVYVASAVLGGREAPSLVDGEGYVEPRDVDLEAVERLDDGVLLSYDVR
ncbi:MAG: dihydrofolate reductase family protein, partial [Halobacteriales archaeon]